MEDFAELYSHYSELTLLWDACPEHAGQAGRFARNDKYWEVIEKATSEF